MMGSTQWNRGGCCGQTAASNNCGSCCNTGSDTSADCCDTCGLTINPDGTSIASNGNDHQNGRRMRRGCCNACRSCRSCGCNGSTRSNSCGNTRSGCGCNTCGWNDWNTRNSDCCGSGDNRMRNSDWCGNTWNNCDSGCCHSDAYTRNRRNDDCCDGDNYNHRSNRNSDCCDNDGACHRNRRNDDCCDGDNYNHRGRRNSDCCDNDDACYRNRRNDECCDGDNYSHRGNRNSDCCDNDDACYRNRRHSDCDSCGNTYHSAIVHHEEQVLDETLCTEEALRQGTLFPELLKPLDATDGCVTEPCASQRQMEAFEAWELRLYLNTHPDDECALKLWRQKCRQAEEPNYACTFAKDCGDGDKWRWVENPWPWENQSDCGHHGDKDCCCGEEA